MSVEVKSTMTKQVLWFIALWCFGFFTLAIASYALRFMMTLAGLHV